MKRVILVFAVMMTSVWAARAQAGQWYVRGDAGYGWSRDAEIKDKGDCNAAGALVGCDKVTGNFGNGFAVGIGGGKQILPWLRADATVTYRGAYSYEVDDNAVSQDLQSWTGMANAYLDIRGLTKTKMGVFHPYVGVGLGVSHNKMDEMRADDGTFAPSGERTDFAWSLTAGTGIMVINKKLMFDIAYRYSDLGEAGGDAGRWSDGWPADATKTHIQLHEVTAGLRYMF